MGRLKEHFSQKNTALAFKARLEQAKMQAIHINYNVHKKSWTVSWKQKTTK